MKLRAVPRGVHVGPDRAARGRGPCRAPPATTRCSSMTTCSRPAGPTRPSIEPFALLSAAAAANPGLGVGVLVTRPGFRPFGIMAKEAAALATISGRTAVLGLGLGDRFGKAEHAVLGLPYPPPDERAVRARGDVVGASLRWSGAIRGRGASAIGPVPGPAAARGLGRGLDRRHVRARRACRRPRGQRLERVGDDAGGVRVPRRGARGLGGARQAGTRPRSPPPGRASRSSGRTPTHWRPWSGTGMRSGGSLSIWRGTVDDLRRLRDRVAAAGATWMIPLAAGPADRLELIIETLRS